MILAVLITLTIIVLGIGTFSVIRTSEVTKTETYKKIKKRITDIPTAIKAFVYKKYQENQYRKIQKQEEQQRLERQRLAKERQEEERILRIKKRQEELEEYSRQIIKSRLEEERQEKERLALKRLKKEQEEKKSKAPKESKTNKQYYKNKDFRKKYSAEIRCIDGHYVRSKAEKRIDDFFFYNHITHIYEPEYYSQIKQKPFCPDFYLPDYNLYIEYFGRTENEYLQKKYEKIEAFRSDTNINFEYIDHIDYQKIESKLKIICDQYKIPVKGEKQ